VVVYGGVWWCMVVYGGVWWCVVVSSVVCFCVWLVWIEWIAINRHGEVAGAGDVADVGFEILDFVEDGRVIEEALLRAIVRTEGGVERDAFARAGAELPDHAVGKSLEVTTGAILPALAGEAVAQRIGARDRIEVAARGEKHFRADEIGFTCRAGRRQIGGLHRRDDGVVGQIHDGDVAGNKIGDVGAGAGAVDDEALGILARVGAGGEWIGRFVSVNVTRGVTIARERQLDVGADVEFHEEVAAGGNGIRSAASNLTGKGNGPRVGEKRFRANARVHAFARKRARLLSSGLSPSAPAFDRVC